MWLDVLLHVSWAAVTVRAPHQAQGSCGTLSCPKSSPRDGATAQLVLTHSCGFVPDTLMVWEVSEVARGEMGRKNDVYLCLFAAK